MLIIKESPFKELLLRLLAIIALLLPFKVMVSHLKPVQFKKGFSKNYVKNTEKRKLHKDKQEKVLALVDKLNAHIEEQAFLFSKIENNRLSLPEFESIFEKLEEIEKEAEKKEVKALIDWPQIHELKKNVESYKQAYLNQINAS